VSDIIRRFNSLPLDRQENIKQIIARYDEKCFHNDGKENDWSHLNCPSCGGSGHVEDATAEQDSRQKQARIERLEAAVKELRDSLFGLTEYAATSDECQYGTLATSFVRNVALEALKNTEDV